jgi:hypothetical protein
LEKDLIDPIKLIAITPRWNITFQQQKHNRNRSKNAGGTKCLNPFFPFNQTSKHQLNNISMTKKRSDLLRSKGFVALC